jgi:hypothetical protein
MQRHRIGWTTRTILAIGLIGTAVLAALPVRAEPESKKPVKVFLLSGQSNMQGYGNIRTLDWLGEDPITAPLLRKVKKPDGTYVERPDVWIYCKGGSTGVKKGNLTVGYGANPENIGPELLFGHFMGDYFQSADKASQVLLIKVSWGGRSLAANFRPPSAGELPLASYPENQRKNMEESIKSGKLKVGDDYRTMIAETRAVLSDLKTHFPAYAGQGYEIAGFVWFQGWNDMIDKAFTAEYAKNLECLINDVRKDLARPRLPVVVAEMGVGGSKLSAGVQTFRKAQVAGTDRPEFKGNVALVDTARCWDEKAQALLDEGYKGNKWLNKELQDQFSKMGSQPPYHYLGSAKVHALIGKELAEAMKELCKSAQ